MILGRVGHRLAVFVITGGTEQLELMGSSVVLVMALSALVLPICRLNRTSQCYMFLVDAWSRKDPSAKLAVFVSAQNRIPQD